MTHLWSTVQCRTLHFMAKVSLLRAGMNPLNRCVQFELHTHMVCELQPVSKVDLASYHGSHCLLYPRYQLDRRSLLLLFHEGMFWRTDFQHLGCFIFFPSCSRKHITGLQFLLFSPVCLPSDRWCNLCSFLLVHCAPPLNLQRTSIPVNT